MSVVVYMSVLVCYKASVYTCVCLCPCLSVCAGVCGGGEGEAFFVRFLLVQCL